MSTDVQELLNTALRLPERDCAELAASLMESLDEAFDTVRRSRPAAGDHSNSDP